MQAKGFTLVELVMVLVIIGIIAGIGAPFISGILDAWLFHKEERNLVFSARMAMNRMVRQIRQVKNLSAIDTFTASEFKFTQVDNTGVDFRQSGNALFLNSDELASELHGPGGLNFVYLDSSGNPTAIKNNLRRVRIRLNLASGDSVIVIESQAALRNL